MIFFSIIIPTFNRASLISATINSVLNGKFCDFEIIIVDDGSTDNTEEVINPLLNDKIKYFKIKNTERAYARNYGVSKSIGKYVTFLDSDDLFYENHLTNAFDCIHKNNFPEWFHCRYDFLDSITNKTKSQDLISLDANKKILEGNFLSCQAVFIKKDIAKNNLFNENRELSTLEDWELWLRMASKYTLTFSNTITSALVQHDNRSVMDFNKTKLINKFKLFQTLILSNRDILKYYSGSLYKFKSSCNSYIALHLALSKKNRVDTLVYLLKSVFQNPKSIFKKRFFATLKHLI